MHSGCRRRCRCECRICVLVRTHEFGHRPLAKRCGKNRRNTGQSRRTTGPDADKPFNPPRSRSPTGGSPGTCLQPKQFSNALPALQRVTAHPVAAVAPEPATLSEVAVKLQFVNETVPDYWRTALNYIWWASAGMSPNAPPRANPTLRFPGSEQIRCKGLLGQYRAGSFCLMM